MLGFHPLAKTNKSVIALVTLMSAVVGCGGRVVPAEGTGGASGTAGTPATGGTSSGGRGLGGSGVAGSAPECTRDAQCFNPPCTKCPDGTSACGESRCVNGACVASVPPCSGGSCNASFCPSRPGGAACCVGPNGPCGVDLGRGCEVNPGGCSSDADCPVPPTPCQQCADGTCAPSRTYCSSGTCVTEVGPCAIVGQCDPGFCAPSGSGKGCCLTPNGPCGVDFGMGCMGPPPCLGCPPPPPPPPIVGTWYKSCAPLFCADAGQINPPLCSVGGAQPGMACAPVGQSCALTLGCSPLLVCSTTNPCVTPL